MSDSPYGYTPSLPWSATFVALFGTSLAVHLYQATRSRYWILFPTLCLGALIEIMGYSARIWSHINIDALDGFLMQICLLIMAPVFFSAYCYVVLGTAIKRLGERYSVIPSKLYFLLFILADLVSLILQAIGGGQAASSAADSAPTQSATDIMVAGIIFQLIAMAIFIACGLDFAFRVVHNKPYAFRVRQVAAAEEKQRAKQAAASTEGAAEQGHAGNADGANSGASTPGQIGLGEKPISATSSNSTAAAGLASEMTAEDQRKWSLVLTSVLISSSMILTRGVFRSVELSAGWSGHLVETEIYQMVLDGIPMIIAVGIFNVLHPGLILGKKTSWKGYY